MRVNHSYRWLACALIVALAGTVAACSGRPVLGPLDADATPGDVGRDLVADSTPNDAAGESAMDAGDESDSGDIDDVASDAGDGASDGDDATFDVTTDLATDVDPDITPPADAVDAVDAGTDTGGGDVIADACVPSAETCNGRDDDCNGMIDDGLGSTTCGIGACRRTTANCVAGVPSTCTPGTSAAEVCGNGIDDDCDGTVDNGCVCGPGDTQACYSGPAATRGVGFCRDGLQTCVAGMFGGACVGERLPAAESCNGIDDDCNAMVDDGLGSTTCGVGACTRTTANCVAGTPRVCMPGAAVAETCNGIDDNCNGMVDDGLGTSTCGVGACTRTTANCVAGMPNVCMPGAAVAESCNGIDDDCNGMVDDGLGTTTCGVGACTRTTANCVAGMPNVCVPGAPAVETCNNMDDNCNGLVDDGVTRSCYSGPVGTAGVGRCVAGNQTCAAGIFGVCVGEVLPALMEVCGNAVDDNCNGMVDEGCVCAAGSSIACYTGPAATRGVGVCSDGRQFCSAGVFAGPCVGQSLPAAEACNGVDDDCDRMTDEGLGTLSCGVGACRRTVPACVAGMLGMCVPGAAAIETCNGIDDDCDGAIDEDGCACIYVSPRGVDTNPGTGISPVRTIMRGIVLAAASIVRMNVCVGAQSTGGVGATCGFNYLENVVMASGITVVGSYLDNATALWPRTVSCGVLAGAPPCYTRIVAQNSLGVRFPAGSSATTVLDGFYVISQGGVGGVRAGVTVEGSAGVISNNCINVSAGPTPPPLPAGAEIYGIDVTAPGGLPATPLITRNFVNQGPFGGGATVTIRGAGIRSTSSAPTIINNGGGTGAAPTCAGLAANCVGNPGDTGTIAGPSTAAGESYGVQLIDSDGTRIEHNTVFGGGGAGGPATVAGVRIQGTTMGTIVRDSCVFGGVTGSGGAHGIWVTGCVGSTPWIVQNDYIVAGSTSAPAAFSNGVYVQGECPVSVERNVLISGGNHPANFTRGVSCEPQNPADPLSPGALCSIQRNQRILGSCGLAMSDATGVYCGPRSCRDVTRNFMQFSGGMQGIEANGSFGLSRGLFLDRSGPIVDANFISGACGPTDNVGADLSGSWGRVINNVIRAGVCGAGGASAARFFGVRQTNDGTANAPDVHSNSIDAGIAVGSCTARAVGIMSLPVILPGRGIYRNNVLRASNGCASRWGFWEESVAADPAVVQNNDFFDAPSALYFNEGFMPLATAASINALVDITTGGNINADPTYLAWPGDLHLNGPACRRAGTSVAAPATDIDVQPRPNPVATAPDIGADEDGL